ncbi:hypothetical protein ACIBEJ_49005 [Nonomuraea sp. NPDC050790]|uniref:hypothetical protein n=1 Tax=Nonomuraea sp. NPDC050790 TaxID=3364371 RepID=UPI0037B284BB
MMALSPNVYRGEYARSISVATEARVVIKVLKARGIPVTDQQQERIQACSDADTLDRWVKRAGLVTTANELFAS